MNKSTIIALFARGREIGFVVMHRGKIVRYGVKTITGRRRGRTFVEGIEKALADVLSLAGPQGVIVAETHKLAHHQGALCRVLADIFKRWERRGLGVCYLSLEEVKESLCRNQKATHSELVEAVADRYPPLQSLITGATIEGQKYWQKGFVAMGLAEVVWARPQQKNATDCFLYVGVRFCRMTRGGDNT